VLLDKDNFGYLSILVTIAATLPYWRLVWTGKTKPHMFTWIVWGLVMGISAAGRSATHAGPGAWGAWAQTLSCGSIAVLAIFKGEKSITRSDLISFVAALLAIPVWLVMKDPLLAIIFVTLIDVVAYYPTVRKSFVRPHEEATYNYLVANTVHVFSLFANRHYSLATCFTPVVMLTANSLLVGMILYRRTKVAAPEPINVPPLP
jgi:hypothetical protein